MCVCMYVYVYRYNVKRREYFFDSLSSVLHSKNEYTENCFKINTEINM